MTHVKSQIFGAALAALVTFVAPSAASTPQQLNTSAPKQQNVTVVNPATKPVNTRVTNTVLTVDADNPDRNAFSSRLCQLGESGTCNYGPTSISAPSDRDLVIDTFSGECSIANAGVFRSLHAYVDPGTGTLEERHFFHPTYATPPGSSHTIHTFNFQTRIQVPANGRLVFFAVSPGDYLAYCHYFVSGYTVIP